MCALPLSSLSVLVLLALSGIKYVYINILHF